ncbi:MAG: 3-hydroxybutyryl-CoA dehydrogenase [Syntrophus sp. SKADARSKE-3]|nr:3-hydroxybutyryl-CoA dehydrogenase [Syntrophus sp. SKADARSKE-3]
MDAKDVKKVVIAGAGIMGHSIAQVFAQSGIEVNLVDMKEDLLERAMRLIKANLKTLSGSGLVKEEDIPNILARVNPMTDLSSAAKGADFALEAVVEIPDVKKEIFLQFEKFCTEDTVLASNTSSLDIFGIAGELTKRDRIVVTHWFAPPHIIPLVEVVPGPETSPSVLDFTAQLMVRLGKRPVVMKAFVPSFIVNRIQQYISMAALEIVIKGWASPEDVDLAVKTSLGIRLPIVGVMQTLDFTGLDLVSHILKSSTGQVPPFIADRVEKGQLGVKTSKGIYDYNNRSEEEILKKRDELYLAMLAQLEKMNAFKPV